MSPGVGCDSTAQGNKVWLLYISAASLDEQNCICYGWEEKSRSDKHYNAKSHFKTLIIILALFVCMVLKLNTCLSGFVWPSTST